MCPVTSEGSSDIEMGHIANLKRGGVGESHRRGHPRNQEPFETSAGPEATGSITIGSTPNIPHTQTLKLHDLRLELLEKTNKLGTPTLRDYRAC